MPRSFLSSFVFAFLASGCVTYDFEPIEPLAIAQTTQRARIIALALKPNLMLLVDNSASMDIPIDPNHSACTENCGGGLSCPEACPTRISDLRAAMASFLESSGADARMGLTRYPSGGGQAYCQPVNEVEVPLPEKHANDVGTADALRTHAQQINDRITKLIPQGGTPTAASLQYVGTLLGLLDRDDNRDDFILLLTDGLPNCNESNPNHVCFCNADVCGTCEEKSNVCEAQHDLCQCTAKSCATQCATGCLDTDNVVQQTISNRKKGIKTIVVGFGASTSEGIAPEVLNAIATAGGFARTCVNGEDSECGAGGKCDVDTKTCERKFYQTTNAAELSDALRQIVNKIGNVDPCKLRLEAIPTRPEFLEVLVDDEIVLSGSDSWTYAADEITFTGEICSRIKMSTIANPVAVEIRIVETF